MGRYLRGIVWCGMCGVIASVVLLWISSCGSVGAPCSADLDCAKGEICLQEQCIVGCRTTFDCAQGLLCLQNKCGDKACNPGDSQACYDGPAGTTGVGLCGPGVQFCDPSGKWSTCSAQQLPQKETCDREDNDCDGKIDNDINCECQPGAERACYTGPDGTLKAGRPCKAGIQACLADNRWGKCRDQRLPAPEVCGIKDNDCDGRDDNGLDCSCKAGETRPCYEGPPNTAGSGICKAGSQACDSKGAWGSCQQAITPSPEICDGKDNDCNGQIDDAIGGCSPKDGGEVDQVPEPSGEQSIDTPDALASSWKLTRKFSAERVVPLDIAVDSSGNIYLVGYFWGIVQFGSTKYPSNGGEDAFLARLQPSGNGFIANWLIQIGGVRDDRALSVAVDENNGVYVSGYMGSGNVSLGGSSMFFVKGKAAFVAKFDGANSGALLWSQVDTKGTNTAVVKLALTDDSVYALIDIIGSLQFPNGTTTITTLPKAKLFRFDKGSGKETLSGLPKLGVQESHGMALAAKTLAANEHVVYVALSTKDQVVIEGKEVAPMGNEAAVLVRFDTTMSTIEGGTFPCSTRCEINALVSAGQTLYAAGRFQGQISQQVPHLISAQSIGTAELFVAALSERFRPVLMSWLVTTKAASAKSEALQPRIFANGRDVFFGGVINGRVDVQGHIFDVKGASELFLTRLDLSGKFRAGISSQGSSASTFSLGAFAVKKDTLWLAGAFTGGVSLLGAPFTGASDTMLFLEVDFLSAP